MEIFIQNKKNNIINTYSMNKTSEEININD